jgi:hypothetical protein
MTQMGFVYEFIGRPATALDLMNVIRDKLIAAGWTLLREYQDPSGNNYKFLMCAPYIMPDGSDAGSAVVEFRNPAGTNHVDVKMWTGWNSQTNTPIPPDCPNAQNGSYLRLAYSYQTGLHYWLYANEYWFALLEASGGAAAGAPAMSSAFKTVVGLALPLAGIPTAPPFKALFVCSPYNTSGGLIDQGYGTRLLLNNSWRSVFIAISPLSGTPWWSNFQSELAWIPSVYGGHPDLPPVLIPWYLHGSGEFKYALYTRSGRTGMGSRIRIGNEVWVPIIGGDYESHGQIWARIA